MHGKYQQTVDEPTAASLLCIINDRNKLGAVTLWRQGVTDPRFTYHEFVHEHLDKAQSWQHTRNGLLGI